MKMIGIDAGSVSVKAVVLDASGEVWQRFYVKHKGQPLVVALDILKAAGGKGDCAIAVTGSAGKLLAELLGVETINEIAAQAYATTKLHPYIRTVIEMGGEDSKLILLGERGLKDFSMNSVCAAGTGSFLDQQAERLNLSIEAFSDLALQSRKPPRIAGRCSVFAKSDMIHLQQIATPVEDIVAGLCFAVAKNFKGSIARGRSIVPPVSFQGGVAANKGMVRAFREVMGLDELFIPPDFTLMGALGAAMKTREAGSEKTCSLKTLEEYLTGERVSAKGHPPLLQEGDAFYERHLKDTRDLPSALPPQGAWVRAYMGIDIGSISTNVAVIDDNNRLLSKRYLMTAGRPIEAVRQGLREVAAEIGDRVAIAGVGTTGSGRYMIADYVSADVIKNEITAQATAAVSLDPTVDTIFEIGGQDSKYISLEDGVIVDFEMNKACAAGTGSFLEEQAEKLAVSIKGEFADTAFSSLCPTRLGERCTVFMENSLMASLQKGTAKNDLFAGLAYSIVQNYINRVVAGRRIGRKIFFQGGVAFNQSVVAAFEKHLGVNVIVPPNHDVTGAIGMALIARQHMTAAGKETSAFRGFDGVERPYAVSAFGCNGCANLCEINRIRMDGVKDALYYGGRCEKYDINRQSAAPLPDLFKFRTELLWQAVEAHKERRKEEEHPARGVIGIPYIFFFNEYLPYWATLLDSLGFDLEVSPHTNRRIVELGLESILSEACFPVKVAIGHIRHLKEIGVDALLLPSFVNLNESGDEYGVGLACPHTQSLPYVARVAVPGMEILAPVIDLSNGRGKLMDELLRAFGRFRVKRRELTDAMAKADQAQFGFRQALRRKGKEVLADLQGKAIVIVGRSYNALEQGMNLGIPEKLAMLGIKAIPMDMLPLDTCGLAEDWSSMYWRSGQKMLRAARFIAGSDKLYPLIIGNFSCGPDSFIMKYFKDELRGKPFLHIEIDEHSADAGVITRCEAFLDSIERRYDRPVAERQYKHKWAYTSQKDRVVFIPPMADHAYAFAAAFERCGIQSEVLPESDQESVVLGMKYASGKECYPCAITTGDMLKKILSPGFAPAHTAFLMPSGSGPCRFGQYNVFHRYVLDSIGLAEVPIFAPNQDEGLYNSLGMVNGDLALHIWKGIIAIELLTKCLHEARPYEDRQGSADELYKHHLTKLVKSLRGNNGPVESALQNVSRDFDALPKTDEHKPLIGIVGEIYVRNNRFSNDNLIRKIESLGGEAWLTPFEEWVHYLNLLNLKTSLRRREHAAAWGIFAKRFVQKRIEHRYAQYFKGLLRTLAEPSTSAILKKAAPYVHHSFEGEAVLSIGKAVDFARRGVRGVVNAMPFGCMPGTIAAALMRAVSQDLDLPVMNMAYEGTEASTNEIQLEAFMDQARGQDNGLGRHMNRR